MRVGKCVHVFLMASRCAADRERSHQVAIMAEKDGVLKDGKGTAYLTARVKA